MSCHSGLTSWVAITLLHGSMNSQILTCLRDRNHYYYRLQIQNKWDTELWNVPTSHSWEVVEPKFVLLSPAGDSFMVEQPRVPTLSLVRTSLWRHFWMADGMLMSLKPWHQVNLTWGVWAHIAFLDLSLCAKEQFLNSQDRRAPQRKGDSTGQS